MMRRLNLSLIVGMLIMIFVLLVSFFPDTFATKDPYGQEKAEITWGEGNKMGYSKPPFPPGPKGILGTDELGRDIYSMIIHGTRPTMQIILTVLILSLIPALLLGMRAGFGGRLCSWFIQTLNTAFSTVPALIFCIIILRMPRMAELPAEQSLLAFAAVVTLVTWPRLAAQIEQKVTEIMGEPFIEGAVAIGKNPLQIAFFNVVPHLVPYLIIFLALEAARVMFMVCQLGVFGVVIGNLGFDPETLTNIGRKVAYEPEWGTMLGASVRRFGTYPWIVFPVVGAFFMTILGFNLLSEGFKIEFEKRDSHFVSALKKIPYIFSPKMFIHDMKNIKTRPLPGVLKIICLLVVIVSLAFPKRLLYYQLDYDGAFNQVQELVQLSGKDAGSASANKDRVAEYIADELASYGLEPGGSDGYFHYFDMGETRFIDKQELYIKDEGGEWEKLVSYYDFRVINFGSGSYEGPGGPNDDLFRQPIIFMSNSTRYDIKDFGLIMDRVRNKEASAVVLISDLPLNVQRNEEPDWFRNQTVPLIEVSREVGERMKRPGAQIRFDIKPALQKEVRGKNIIAVLPGSNKDSEGKFIMIGTGYGDLIRPDGEAKLDKFLSKFQLEQLLEKSKTGALEFSLENLLELDSRPLGSASSAGMVLQLAKRLAARGQPSTTIVFAFWDYPDSSNNGADAFGVNPPEGFDFTKGVLYIELRDLGIEGIEKLVIDSSRNPPSRPDTQRMGKILKNGIKQLGFEITGSTIKSKQADAMQFRGMSCIILQPENAAQMLYTIKDAESALDRNLLGDAGQGILNALLDIAY